MRLLKFIRKMLVRLFLGWLILCGIVYVIDKVDGLINPAMESTVIYEEEK